MHPQQRTAADLAPRIRLRRRGLLELGVSVRFKDPRLLSRAASGLPRPRSRIRAPSAAPKLSHSPAATQGVFHAANGLMNRTRFRTTCGVLEGRSGTKNTAITSVPRELAIRKLPRARMAQRTARTPEHVTQSRCAILTDCLGSALLTLNSINRHRESLADGSKRIRRKPRVRAPVGPRGELLFLRSSAAWA